MVQLMNQLKAAEFKLLFCAQKSHDSRVRMVECGLIGKRMLNSLIKR